MIEKLRTQSMIEPRFHSLLCYHVPICSNNLPPLSSKLWLNHQPHSRIQLNHQIPELTQTLTRLILRTTLTWTVR